MMRKKLLLAIGATLAIVVFLTASLTAQAPPTITYQGKLVDNASGDPITTATTVDFSIYGTVLGGSALWSEQLSVAPSQSGVFTVELGLSNTDLPTILTGDKLFLELIVGGETLTPRQVITSAAYAYSAKVADLARGVQANSIDEQHLRTSAVTEDKIGNGAVTTGKIQPNAVTADKLDPAINSLLPVAFGWISGDGTIRSGYNIVSSSYNATSGIYEIRIAEAYSPASSFVTVVTTSGVFADPRVDATGDGRIAIQFSGLTLDPNQGFQFVTYKP